MTLAVCVPIIIIAYIELPLDAYKGTFIGAILSLASGIFTFAIIDSIEEYYFKEDKYYENFLNDNS